MLGGLSPKPPKGFQFYLPHTFACNALAATAVSYQRADLIESVLAIAV
jgi:hypothetical protein